jgi:hypothetical protein
VVLVVGAPGTPALATAILDLDGRPMHTLPLSAKGIPLVERT